MKKKVRFLLMGIFMSMLPYFAGAQLSGFYTIGGSGADYSTIAAALTDLNSTKGVNGRVVFTINAGTYNEDIYISKAIVGASSKNTVTFRGVGKYKVILKDTYPLYLYNADYVKVENITFQGSTYGLNIQYSDYCRVSNCIVFASTASTSSTYRGAHVYRCNNDTLEENRIVGGYYGIYAYGTGTSYGSNENNVFTNNDVLKVYYYGIYHYYGYENSFDGNRIDSMRGNFTYRWRNYYCSRTKIRKNKLYFTGNYGYGIYMYYESYYPTTATNTSEVSNNFIGGSPSTYMYGLYITTNSKNVSVLNNTVVASGTSTSSRGLYITSGSGQKVFNNNFYQQGKSGYAMYISSASYLDSMDYNNVYSNASNFVYFAGNRTSLSALKTYGNTYGLSQNSISEDLALTDLRDYKIESSALNNKGFKWVPLRDDIEGRKRPTSPDKDLDIGCYDYYLPANDAGMASFPTSASCPGTVSVSANLKNFGTATLTDCNVNWSIAVDGVKYIGQTSKTYSGSLKSGASTSISLGSFNMQVGKEYMLKSWTTNPNKGSDTKAGNDTCYTTMAAALNGNFTIGSGGDYSTIADAVNDLNDYGICGPTNFRLLDAEYKERIILSNIAGTSKTNTLRFVGKGWKNTKIVHSAISTADWSTVLINGTDYTIFDSLNIEANGVSYGVCYWMTDANYNVVTNSQLKTNQTSTSSNFRVYNASSSTTGVTNGLTAENNRIENCTLLGGYYGYYINSGSSTTRHLSNHIINCDFYHQYYYPLYTYGAEDARIVNNTIDSIRNTSGYGMYMPYGVNDSIAGNKVRATGAYAMYFYYNNRYGVSTDTTYFVNNMISGGATYTLYASIAYRVKYYNNSFYGNNTYTTYHSTSTGSEWKNNCYHNESGYAFYLSSTSGIASGAIDYNNYYGPNSTSLAYYSGAYTDLAAWQLAVGTQNLSSMSVDPVYNSISDLHTLSPNLNNNGTKLSRFNVDIDGDKRPTSPDTDFDIGADDYYLAPYDLDIIAVSPSIFSVGKNKIHFTVRNTGINDLINQTAYVSYTIGTTTIKDTLTIKSLVIGASMDFEFTIPYNMTGTSSVGYCVNIDSGIKGDPDKKDEACETACLGLSGTFSIDPSGNGDFKTFGEAVSAVSGCGIASSVVFEVEPGTYTERVVLPEINGTDRKKTIKFINKGKKGDVIISNRATSIATAATVQFNGVDHVTFDNMVIEGTGTGYGVAVQFIAAADYNKVSNCILRVNQTSSSSNFYVINFTSSLTSLTTYGNSGNYNVFENNRILGGYYGVRINGISSSSKVMGNSFYDNDFMYQYYYPIYTYYSAGHKVVRNVIDSQRYTTQAYGARFYYCGKDSIAGNLIKGRTYGLYYYYGNYTGSATSDTSYIINNMISCDYTNNYVGAYMYYSDRTYFVGNSVYSGGTSTSTSYGNVRFYYCDDNVIRNNSMYRAGNGYALNYYNGINPNLDNNNWYSPNATNPIYYNATNYATLAAYQLASSQDANSVALDPEYVSKTDLHSKSVNLNNKGANMPRFATDFDGDKRPQAPDAIFDIGADEYYLPDYDADVTAIGTSSLTFGNNTITVTVENNGLKTWLATDTLYLQYSIDGGTAVTQSFLTGALAKGQKANYTFTTAAAIGSTPYADVCVNFYKRFKQADPDKLSEEYCQSSCVKGIPRATIGSSGQLKTIAEAQEYLTCIGSLTSPITFRMSGDFKEQITFTAVTGASSTNTIRFVGEGWEKTSWSHDGTGGYHTLQLAGADYFIFDSLNIYTSSTGAGRAVHLMSAADNNTFSNCRLAASTTTTSSNNVAVISSSSTTGFGYSNNANALSISNSRIEGGYYGLALLGSSTTVRCKDHVITNNTFRNSYYYAEYLNYIQNARTIGNDYNSLRNASGSAYYSNYGIGNAVIANEVKSGNRGLYINYENYNTSDTSAVVNNMISKLTGTSQSGIYANNSDNVHFIHNSIWTNITNTTTSYAAGRFNACDKAVIKNNIFANTGNGLPFYQNAGILNSGDVDYNDYYSSSFYVGYWGGYATSLTALQALSTGHNVNSLNADPGFESEENLHSFSDNVNNKGTNTVTWPTDIDGQARPLAPDVTVDMGADDFWIPLYDVDIQSIEATAVLVNGKNKVQARFQNRGLRNLTGEKGLVSYTIDSGTREYDTIDFKFLMVGSDTLYTFNKPWKITKDGSYHLCVASDSIFTRSSDRRNEMCVDRCTGTSDTLWVDANGMGDYLTISEAISRVSCGITGPTVIYIKEGTYKESVALSSVLGTSTTNTIEIIGESRKGVIWDNGAGFSTLLLSDVQHLSITNLTMLNSAMNTSAGSIVHLMNSCEFIDLSNCDLLGSKTTTNSNTAIVTASGSSSSISTQGANVTDLSITDCKIEGAYYGIRLNGEAYNRPSPNVWVENVSFKHQNSYGMYLYQMEMCHIEANTVDSLRGNGSMGIYSLYGQSNQIINNKITNDRGYGIYTYLDNYYGSVSDTSWVYNNTINLTGNNANAYAGFYGYYANRNMIYHNTIVTTTTSTSDIGSALYLNQISNGTEVKNNILSAMNGGSLVYYAGSGMIAGDVDNNNYYTTGTFDVYWSADYTSLKDWQTAYSSDNVSSLEGNPYFINSTDMHPGGRQLMASGADLGIDEDLDGNTRHSSKPDIGAFKVWKDATITKVSSPMNDCRSTGDLDTVKTVLINNGQSAFVPGDTVFVSYQDGASSVEIDTLVVPTGVMLIPGTTVDHTFETALNSGTAGTHNLNVWTSYRGDADKTNDLFKHTFYSNPNPAAGFTVAEQCEYETSEFASTSTVALGAIDSWKWVFGDGKSNTGKIVDHDYAMFDTFQVQLAIATDSGCVDTFWAKAITHPKPSAGFTTADVCHTKDAEFANTSTIDHGSMTHAWDFGNSISTSSLESPKLDYPKAGKYTVELLTTSDKGCKDTAEVAMEIYPTPVAGFTATEECQGESTELDNTTTISAGSFSSTWTLGDGAMATTTDVSRTYVSAKTYSVKLVEQTTMGCADSISKNVVVNPNPTSSFQVTNMCFGDKLSPINNSTLNANNMWYFGDGNTSTDKSPEHTYKASGTYDASLVASTNKGCSDSTSNQATVANQPLADFTFSDDCVHNAIDFTNATSVACGTVKNYNWNFGDGTVQNITTKTNPSYRYDKAGTYTVQLVITLSNNSTDTAKRTLTVYDQPMADFAHDPTCQGNLMAFANKSTAQSSTTLTSFAWTFGDGGNSSLKSPTNTYNSTGNYRLQMIVTDSRSCSDSMTKTITVSPNPSVNFSYKNACSYDDIVLTNSSSVSAGSISTYAWDFGNNTMGTNRNEAVTYGTSGSYQVKMIATSDQGCMDSISKTVTSFAVPTARFSASNVCDKEDMMFTNLSSGATGYAWDFGDMMGTSSSSAPSYMYAASGSYKVALVASNASSCTDTVWNTMMVNALPTAGFTAADVCDGTQAAFTNTTKGASSYAWAYGDGQGSSVSSPNHTYSKAGAYTVELIAISSNACRDTAMGSLTVNANPVVAFTAGDECLYDSVMISNKTLGATSLAWDYGDGNAATTKRANHKYASAGSYNLVLTATSAASCTAKDSATVSVWAVPTAGFTHTTACLGDATSFTNTSKIGSGTMSNSWDFGNLTGSSNNVSPSYTYASASSYTVELTATSGNGCIDKASNTVTVNALPTPNFSASNACQGTSVSFTNSSSGGSTYAWDFDDGKTSTSSAPSNSFAKSGTYQVELTAKSSTGCEATASKSLTIYDLPTANFSAINNCEGDSIFPSNLSLGASSYSWNFGDGNSSTAMSPGHAYAAAKKYNMTLTATSSNNCTDQLSRTIDVYALPTASVSAAVACEGFASVFTNSSTGATNYNWSFGDGNSATGSSASYTYASDGVYDVILQAVSSRGCTDAATVKARVNEQPVAMFNATKVCANDSTMFTNNSTGTIFNTNWIFGDGNNSKDVEPSHAYATGGTYQVKLTVTTIASCSDNITQTVTVLSQPEAMMAASDACLNEDVVFSDNGSQGNGAAIIDREWLFGDGNSDFGRSVSHRYSKDTIYDAKMVVSTLEGCTDTVSQMITIHPTADVQFAIADTCSKSKLNISNMSTINSGTIASQTWTFSDGFVSTQAEPKHPFDTFGVYDVSLELVSDQGCVSMKSDQVSIHPNPDAFFVTYPICLGDSALFQNHSMISTGTLSYAWDFGDGATSIEENPWHEFAALGKYNVKMSVISNEACAGVYEMKFEVHEGPDAQFALMDVCQKDSLLIPDALRDSMKTDWVYQMDFGNGDVIQTIPTGYVYPEIGDYEVKLTIRTDINCVDSATYDIAVLESPELSDFAYTRQGGQTIDFSIEDASGLTLDWDFGDGNTDNGENPSHNYATPGSYEVTCKVTNANGCSDELTKTVDVYPTGIHNLEAGLEFSAYPNPFKDQLTISYELEKAMYVRIEAYNMQGQLVKTIVNRDQESGEYQVNLTGYDLPASGNLVLRVIADDQISYHNLTKLR